MSWSVLWTKPAVKDMQRLDKPVAQRIRDAVLRMAQAEGGSIKRLRGSRNELRLRVGDWRVRFTYDPDTNRIYIQRVLPRGKAYRD